MNVEEMQQYLYEHIPITRAMGVEVCELSLHQATLFAPLAPNINHRDTVFGGSASTLAILSAWVLLHVRLREDAVPSRLVIQHNTMNYTKPIAGDFYAVCHYDNDPAWERFKAILERRHRARIAVTSVLQCNHEVVADFEGQFVALRS